MASSISDALAKLDPANDSHWTADGAPRTDVVTNLLGQKVTRKEITEAAPELTRGSARAPVGTTPPAAAQTTANAPGSMTAADVAVAKETVGAVGEPTEPGDGPPAEPTMEELLADAEAVITEKTAARQRAEDELQEAYRERDHIVEEIAASEGSPAEQHTKRIRALITRSYEVRAARAARATGNTAPTASPLDRAIGSRPRQTPATHHLPRG